MTTERNEVLSVEQQLWNQALRQIADPIMAAHVLELFTEQPDFQRTYPGVYLMAKANMARHERKARRLAAVKTALFRTASWLKSLVSSERNSVASTPRADTEPRVPFGHLDLDPV